MPPANGDHGQRDYIDRCGRYGPGGGGRRRRHRHGDRNVGNYKNIIPALAEVGKYMKNENMGTPVERLSDGRIKDAHQIDWSDPKNRAELARAIDQKIAEGRGDDQGQLVLEAALVPQRRRHAEAGIRQDGRAFPAIGENGSCQFRRRKRRLCRREKAVRLAEHVSARRHADADRVEQRAAEGSGRAAHGRMTSKNDGSLR